ncbi:MAG: VOC family protein [Scytonematopsis contorta HA4267-MV1]|jgi:catechol 2,3-dioxygenase-like lactoylglutathione lyase family enzyme|nr:VOC family protein [Scytonematopsis contorta HA4267-MV1]
MNQGQKTAIEGIYEVCIGVPDPTSAIEYWQQFGYHMGCKGNLNASEAYPLYGVNSSLKSIRLYHQNSDHGLIRLMSWEQPTNDGLGMGSMKVKGNRWSTSLTSDLLNILNHAEEAEKAGRDIKYTNPRWEIIYNKNQKMNPFIESMMGVREMMLLQPFSRQVFFQRFGYTMPHYGNINHDSLLKTSQFTHMGLVVQDDSKEIVKFYEDVFGLLRVRDDVETSYDSSIAGREIFDLLPGERFFLTAFDDPRSSVSDLMAVRSGRLYIIRFPDDITLNSQFEAAQPGSLGMCLYTYRVGNIQEYFDRIKSSNAQKLTNISVNEFGETSFSFVAPDGYFWNFVNINSQ